MKILLLVSTTVVSTLLLAVHHPWQNQDDPRPCRCIEVKNVLETAQRLKPGMTRKEVEQHLERDGGVQFQSPTRYTVPACNYIKIDVEFQVDQGGSEKRNELLSPEDVVVGISKPYIVYPTKD
jgi:hypothetical protein